MDDSNLGSFTWPPTFTGPSGLISGAGGATTSDEPIPSRGLFEAEAGAIASKAGAASLSAPAARCELTGCAFNVALIMSGVTRGSLCFAGAAARLAAICTSCV